MSSIRQKILDAAIEHLKHHTLADAQINALCQSAEISRTSFYREFKNLDDMFSCLVIALWTSTLEDIISEVHSIEPSEKRLFEFAKRVASIAQTGRYLPGGEENITQAVKLLYKEDGKELGTIIEAAAPFISTCQQQGAIRQDLQANEVADWILRQMWMLMSLPLTSIFSDKPLDRYIQVFIVDALKPNVVPGIQSDDVNNKLDQILDKLRYL